VQIGNSEVLLAAVYKPQRKPWCDEEIIHLSNLSNIYLLAAGDLKAKNHATLQTPQMRNT
jgi:hypothetical protein